jgi:hypothetical protein
VEEDAQLDVVGVSRDLVLRYLVSECFTHHVARYARRSLA